MKILLVTEDLPVENLGGAGKHAVLLGNALIAAGHQVELLGRERAPGLDGKNQFVGPLHALIDLRGTGWQEYRFGAFLPGRREHAAYRVWAAIRQLGLSRFDVIHYHGHLTALGAIVPASVPFVQTLHDQGSECMTMTRFRQGQVCRETDPRACAGCATARPNALQRGLSTAAVRRMRRKSVESFARHPTIFVSDFLRSRFIANVQPAQAPLAQVIYNFTDADAVATAFARAMPSAPDLRPVALLVGRIDAAKGFGAFLDALPADLLRHWRFRVVGDGPQRADLQARHGPRGIEFAGQLPLVEVYQETASAALCIVPSVCEEPCGTTLLEALALGRPTLALASGGTPELRRFERYPGQLTLVGSISMLIAELADRLTRPGQTVLLHGVGHEADVMQRLPEIVAAYQRAEAAAAAARPTALTKAEP